MIVCGVAKTVGSKVIVSAPPVVFAWPIAWRRSIWPVTGVVQGAVDGDVDSSLRSSSAKSVGCNRHRRRFRASTVARPPLRGWLAKLYFIVLSLLMC